MRKYNVQEANNIALGQLGCDFKTGLGTYTGNWVAIKSVTGGGLAVALTGVTFSIGAPIAPVTPEGEATFVILGQGDMIYGPITSFSILVGTILAYRG